VVLDIVGPAVEPPVLTSTRITPGAVDPRWHVNAAWFSDNAAPASFAAAEVIPERSVRMFAARDPGQKAVALRVVYEAWKMAKPEDPKLAPASKKAIEQV